MEQFKIRCSAIGKIVSSSSGITEKQKGTIDMLSEKEKITDKQKETLSALIEKRDNPQLPETVKGYCEDWYKGKLYDSKEILQNKYLDKGNIMEDESIDFIADNLDYGFLMKNEEHFENDFVRGTPDVILKDTIIDVKNSWSCFTFPLFDSEIKNKDYYWQLQGYMYLTGRTKAKLIYVLSDTPEHLIHNEAKWYCIKQGYQDLDIDIYDRYHKNMTYDKVDNKFKIKVFDIERNEDDIKFIKDRVIECRNYIKSLDQILNSYERKRIF